MRIITMTDEQTTAYHNGPDDARVRVITAMHDLAMNATEAVGGRVEIHTADGFVVDSFNLAAN